MTSDAELRRAAIAVPGVWYVACAYAIESRDESSTVMPGDAVVHAKRAGTTVTACGISTLSWPLAMHLEFAAATVNACGSCRHAVARMRQTIGRCPVEDKRESIRNG